MTITRLEFLRRFTSEERVMLRTVAKNNAALEDYMALLDAAQDVDVEDPDTVAGVHTLEALGLIGAGRAQTILVTDVEPIEAAPVLPVGFATVYQTGSNFTTVFEGQDAPEAYDKAFEVSAVMAKLIENGAEIRPSGDGIEIFQKVA